MEQVLKILKGKAMEGEKSGPLDANSHQPQTNASIQTERAGAPAGKNLQNRPSSNRVVPTKRVREPKAVDGSKCGECQHMNHASEQHASPLKGPDGNAAKRLLRRNLAVDIEMLKEEMEHMKAMLASHESLLTQRFKKKRVSFTDER
ncbi:hypothetical protein N7509_008272 [Penicillium cosmopolitanum]|uniref:Uncharacterized protein n=1 Tax=Penicillium cosmopolitanum TaxID=1131564 RepID=A0A9X0B2H5_9EURO|nr:uncharacterized protein N7509_008272 [Penicillium cosmopolitanum]KAJ5385731.1 hypothetical protein N7509_008272 [Penicillium cosmopolitanum]